MTLFLSLMTATATPATPADWSPREIEVANTLNGGAVQTTEQGGWILRTAGGYGNGSLGYADDERAYAPAMEGAVGAPRGRPAGRPSAKPSRMKRTEAAAVEASEVKATEAMAGEPAPSTAGLGTAVPQPGLKAGTTDDNAAFGEYLEFLATWGTRTGATGGPVAMDVADQRFIRVHDGTRPIPGAHITVENGRTGEVAWSGTTYGDGSAAFYAGLSGLKGGDYRVTAQAGGVKTSTAWDGASDLALDLDDAPVTGTVPLDVVFVIDTTGSMSDEIDRIKATLLTVTDQVNTLDTPVDLRYGAVLYRDIGDAYLTKHTPLTRDLKAFDAKLQGIGAAGGGDGPEALNQGLAVAVGEMDWRTDGAKMVFLVADAEPHMDYEGDTTYAETTQAAMDQGIRIHTVAASGLADFGSVVFRQTAQLARGEFVFIEYGSTAASAADHGVTGPVKSNNLDDILLRQIEREVYGWGAPADAVASR